MKKVLFISAISLLCIACNSNNSYEENAVQVEEQSYDWMITAKVKAAILADTALSANAKMVTVNTTNGIVTLSGGVPTKDEKDRIEDTVKHVQGVKKINNQLIVIST